MNVNQNFLSNDYFGPREKRYINNLNTVDLSQCPFTLPLSFTFFRERQKVKYLIFTTIKSNRHVRSLFNPTRPDIALLV